MLEFLQKYWYLVGGALGLVVFALLVYRRVRAGHSIRASAAMASVVGNYKVVVPLLTAGLLGLCYFISLDVFDDPRMIDGELRAEEMRWWETVLMLIALGSILTLWSASIQHAWRRGRGIWTFLMILLWPLALLYAVLPHT